MQDVVFDSYSNYYDLLYRDKNYKAEVDYIHNLLLQGGISNGDLLEFGSGTGKHGRLLANLGYCVHGIELSLAMLEKASQGMGFTCQHGDICSLNMGRKFDAVISLFHVISYQIPNNLVIAAFKNASEHIRPGGLFIFDVWYTPAVYSEPPSTRIKRMADSEVEITRIAEPSLYPNENRVDVVYEILAKDLSTGVFHTLTETHSMRHFSLPEIDLLANLSGFKRIDAQEFLTGKSPGINTWGVCVVLRKD